MWISFPCGQGGTRLPGRYSSQLQRPSRWFSGHLRPLRHKLCMGLAWEELNSIFTGFHYLPLSVKGSYIAPYVQDTLMLAKPKAQGLCQNSFAIWQSGQEIILCFLKIACFFNTLSPHSGSAVQVGPLPILVKTCCLHRLYLSVNSIRDKGLVKGLHGRSEERMSEQLQLNIQSSPSLVLCCTLLP